MDVVLHESRLVLLPLHGRVRQVGLLLGDLILDRLFEVVLQIPARENLLHPRYAGGLFVSAVHMGEMSRIRVRGRNQISQYPRDEGVGECLEKMVESAN